MKCKYCGQEKPKDTRKERMAAKLADALCIVLSGVHTSELWDKADEIRKALPEYSGFDLHYHTLTITPEE